ncbi:AVAST type 1 anti-phage system protein Avs1c [Paenibacillus campi]|uniref:AVAST type 1 anti-phage system protein Avs1c n=1 Tax=Paenibacillus campi TaxID=3106031 RepID=UPI002AFF15F8|nr:AVAST type 1 anti-phage system protein Avs1c [Paenibacillus sp. SGZ-1014]
MNIEQMNTPRNRSEFERNFFIAQESFRDHKVHFSTNVSKSIDGLRKVRTLPNNRIDFLSVDESARLYVNTIANVNRW